MLQAVGAEHELFAGALEVLPGMGVADRGGVVVVGQGGGVRGGDGVDGAGDVHGFGEHEVHQVLDLVCGYLISHDTPLLFI